MSDERKSARDLRRDLTGSGVKIEDGVKGGMDAAVSGAVDMLKIYKHRSPGYMIAAVEEAVKAFRGRPDDALRFVLYQCMHNAMSMQLIDPRIQMERKDVQGLSS